MWILDYSLLWTYSTTAVQLMNNYNTDDRHLKIDDRHLKINDPRCCGTAPSVHVRVLMGKWQGLMT